MEAPAIGAPPAPVAAVTEREDEEEAEGAIRWQRFLREKDEAAANNQEIREECGWLSNSVESTASRRKSLASRVKAVRVCHQLSEI